MKPVSSVEQLIEEYELTVSELEQEKARANALFLSIGDGAVATDTEGKIYQINDAALKILGISESQAIGKWFPALIVARDQDGNLMPPLSRLITRAIIEGKAVSGTLFYETKAHMHLPVFVTASPIKLNGRPIGAIEVFRDISREHEVNRMKSEFISLASHQLRTPLTAINTYSRMLAGGYAGGLSKEQLTYMDTILASVDRMNQIITALLDIAKLESGKMEVSNEKVDLVKLLTDLAEEMSGDADRKSIQLNFKSPLKSAVVVSDRLLVREVCVNLLSNAIKYTPRGGKIDIRVAPRVKNMLITVKDNGYGIPKDVQHRVFSKFFRAPNIIYKEMVGTGLGLYTVKSIADALGGRVWFKSTEGKGSTFGFAVPKNPQPAADKVQY